MQNLDQLLVREIPQVPMCGQLKPQDKIDMLETGSAGNIRMVRRNARYLRDRRYLAPYQVPTLGARPLRKTFTSAATELLPRRFCRVSLLRERIHVICPTADVFLHVSTETPYPLVLLQATACGPRDIAHDTPCARCCIGDEEFLGNADGPPATAAGVTIEYAVTKQDVVTAADHPKGKTSVSADGTHSQAK